MTMTEMYSKNHAVSFKLHVIKHTVNTINCNDYRIDPNIRRCFFLRNTCEKTQSSYIQGLDFDMSIIQQ